MNSPVQIGEMAVLGVQVLNKREKQKMNIIIPMAGRGSRLRPHTLTTPKPLIPIAGIPIVERLVEDIVRTLPVAVKKIAFVTGRFGEDVRRICLKLRVV